MKDSPKNMKSRRELYKEDEDKKRKRKTVIGHFDCVRCKVKIEIDTKLPVVGDQKQYTKLTFTPTQADRFVLAFRNWLRKHGNSQPEWFGHANIQSLPSTYLSKCEEVVWKKNTHWLPVVGLTNFPFAKFLDLTCLRSLVHKKHGNSQPEWFGHANIQSLPSTYLSKREMLDRYEQHTLKCSSCKKAHKTFETLQKFFIGATVALCAAAGVPPEIKTRLIFVGLAVIADVFDCLVKRLLYILQMCLVLLGSHYPTWLHICCTDCSCVWLPGYMTALQIADVFGYQIADVFGSSSDPVCMHLFGLLWIETLFNTESALWDALLCIYNISHSNIHKKVLAIKLMLRNGDIPLRNRPFPEKIGYDVKIIDVLALLEDEEEFSKVSDEDVIRVCLLLSLEKGREAALIDRVHDLEGICKTSLKLSKEVKSLRGRFFKLKSIIQASIYLTRGFGKEETLKKVGLQIEYFLQTTSEVEQDIKDDTSPKEHYKYTYNSKQEDQIIRLADQRQHDDILNMAEVAEQKIQFEIQRLYKHRETMNKIAEDDKQRKFIWHMNSSSHMKLAIEMCMLKKRKYVDVMRSLYSGLSITMRIPSIE
nr:pheophorbide A oxygenase, chloroplastic [Tanacetum cinerariifolium]